MGITHDKFWHLRTTDEALKELNTTKQGLTEQEAEKRLTEAGENKLQTEKPFRWRKVLLEKANSLLIYILLAAGGIAYFTGEKLEAGIILIIILMTVLLGFWQEYNADKTIKALAKLTAKKVHVRRGGKKQEMEAEKLVPGDIVHLKRGDIVPADLRLLEATGLHINEAVITGESQERVKTTTHLSDENVNLGDMTNIAFSSTHVTGGSGVGVVTTTGMDTHIGRITSSIESIKHEKTPIQKKIDRMSTRISYIVITIAALLLIILLLQGQTFLFSILLVSALAIAGIPESFPLALTVTFSHGIKKMARQNAIVKDMNSVETLGTTTVICTDKTGTLTENKMRVTEVHLPTGTRYDVKGKGYEPVNEFYDEEGRRVEKKQVAIPDQMLKTCVLCNEAELSFEDGEWNLYGEPTEGSLLSLAESLDYNEHGLREDHKRVHLLPFDPARKYMISVNKEYGKKDRYGFHLKGAGEIVLEKCARVRTGKNKSRKLTPKERKRIHERIEEANKKGLRVLSLASKEMRKEGKSTKQFIKKHLEKGYVYEGFVGIEDPIREEVYDAVHECKRAGVKTVMITGDHNLIAQTIGERLHIFNKSTDKILEGHELDKLTDEELDDVIGKVTIFSRTSPEHKLRIVKSFQRRGEIVAMTGDGVNDAPALKKSDVGISMGKEGTEVAREASNMVLTDDNFATIVTAVREGRTVYNNIRRFIYYLLTGNFTEIGLLALAVIIGIPLPLTALMILFVNLVTSTIPALALSIEPTHQKVMNQKPRDPKERLLSDYILTKILVLVPLVLGGTLSIFLWDLHVHGAPLEKAMTVAFATLIFFELFHAFNARRLHTTIFDKGFFNNPHLFGAVGASALLTLGAIYTETGREVFGTMPITPTEWGLVLGLSATVVILSEIIKLSVKAEFKEQGNLQGREYKLQ